MHHLISILLIITITIIIYSNVLLGEFLYDDLAFINENYFIKDLSYFLRYFYDIKTIAPLMQSAPYRPLVTLSFAINYYIAGMNPGIYHLTNVLLHIGCGILVYFLINALIKNWFISLLSSLFFIVHPINSEAVAWISGRSNGISLFFFLSSFLLYLYSYKEDKHSLIFCFILSLICYLLAMLGKESAILLPFYLLIFNKFFHKNYNFNKLFPYFVIGFVYLIARAIFIKHLIGIESPHKPVEGILTPILLRIESFVRYIILLVYPHNFSAHHPIPTEFSESAFILISEFFIVIIFLFLIYKNSENTIKFSILWILISLFFPVIFIFHINALVAERLLYTGTVGLSFIFEKCLSYIEIVKNKFFKFGLFVLGIFILLIFSCITFNRGKVWQNSLNLWQEAYKKYPDSWLINFNLATSYDAIEQLDAAIEYYNRVLKIGTPSKNALAGVYNDLGIVYAKLKEYNKAYEYFTLAIENEPKNHVAYYNLGKLFLELNQPENARVFFLKSLEIFPYYTQAREGLELARIAWINKKIAEFETQIKKEPRNAELYFELGSAYLEIKQWQKGIENLEKAVSIKPDFIKAHLNLGNAYVETGRVKEGIEHYNIIIKLGPNQDKENYEKALYNLKIAQGLLRK
jgi:Tfp pilus assembly protein PilF